MSNSVNDLWPSDIGSSKLIAPEVIIKEQAALLSSKTNNLVEAKVETIAHATQLEIKCYLVTKALPNSKPLLFKVINPLESYPASVYLDGQPTQQVNSYDELVEALRHIFASDKIRNLVAGLMAQSEAKKQKIGN